MGMMHIGATFSPLIGGKMACLDESTFKATVYMSLMCGMLLVALGGYVWWASGKMTSHPMLKPTVRTAATLLLIDGISAVILMSHNPFAWVTATLCLAVFTSALVQAKSH